MPTHQPRSTAPVTVEPAAAASPGAPAPPPTSAPQDNQAANQAAYTVEHAVNDFFDRGLLDNSERTRTCYQQRAGHLLRLLGALPVTALHLDQVQQYAEDRVTEGAAR